MTTVRAIYAVVEERQGYAKVAMLGDGSAIPVQFMGRGERDALGYRTTQYDELVKVDPDILRREVARRAALMEQMVWTRVYNSDTQALITLYDMNQDDLNDLVGEAMQSVDTDEEQSAVEGSVTWWCERGKYGLDIDAVDWNAFMAYVRES